ncbi:MAG: hypothetical protein AB7H80_12280 [Candidatus Kapaibacterium sp.]
MNTFLFLLGLLSFTSLCSAQSTEPIRVPATGDSVPALVPAGWHLLDSATGDLNKDHLDDLVLVIEADKDESEPERTWGDEERTLVVYFRKKRGGYQYAVQADNLVILASDGGVMGDPYEGVEVNRGSFLIHFYGGSSWRWGMTYRFRFQEGEWYLIGSTEYSMSTQTGEYHSSDYNLLTGELEIASGNEFGETCVQCRDCDNCPSCSDCDECQKCTKEEVIRKRVAREPLPTLHEFGIASWSNPGGDD